MITVKIFYLFTRPPGEPTGDLELALDLKGLLLSLLLELELNDERLGLSDE